MAWMGYDKFCLLGKRETGGQAGHGKKSSGKVSKKTHGKKRGRVPSA